MKAETEYLWFQTAQRREFVNITERVREVVRRSAIREGMVLVSAMHITAAVYVNDNERGLIQDIQEWADRLAPPGDYRHHQTGEDNGDCHLKNLLLGRVSPSRGGFLRSGTVLRELGEPTSWRSTSRTSG